VFAFFLLMAVMLIATLYPFNFFPVNGVQWLSNEPGLYFNGHGIAYTDRAKTVCATKAVSVVLWLKERFGSKNWGPREIFSFYDGFSSPPLVIGQWGGRIFLYSRFEKNEGDKWYRLFRTTYRFPRGKPHFVTVTFGAGAKAIYVDGKLNNKMKTDIHDTARIEFCGRLTLGNSPTARNGWWGEVKGLAIYNRVLLPEEIKKHSTEISQGGVRGLAETPGCLALYLFDEGEGSKVKSIVGKLPSFSIPNSRTPLILATLFNLPHKDMRTESLYVADFLKNILFFVPYGILFSTIMLRKFTTGYFLTFVVVILAGGLLSLTIEFLQLFHSTRTSVITDMAANIAGSGLGFFIIYFLKKKGDIISRANY
jgi:VanZ family protein